MSIYYRKQYYREMQFKKNLHLKKYAKLLLNVLPENYTFDDIITAFKDCFPCAWDEILLHCKQGKQNYIRRSRKNLRTVPYYTPEQFIKKNMHLPKRSKVLKDSTRQAIYADLVKSGAEKKKKRDDQLAARLLYVQEVCPSYIKKLIQTYFAIRRTDPLNINARYLIIQEASQFRCPETIEFLHKINACDKNTDLRQMAFFSLQRMGEHPWLERNRKGKKHMTMIKPIDIEKNPTELLMLIAKNQSLLFQSYDVFLSHSSLDEKELLQLKAYLNHLGKTVYIDWVNDRVMLNRENQNQDTWNALMLRMDQSRVLLYVLTDNSIKSKYTEREVNYFKEASKKIIIYKPHTVSITIPEYLEEYGVIAKDDLAFL